MNEDVISVAALATALTFAPTAQAAGAEAADPVQTGAQQTTDTSASLEDPTAAPAYEEDRPW